MRYTKEPGCLNKQRRLQSTRQVRATTTTTTKNWTKGNKGNNWSESKNILVWARAGLSKPDRTAWPKKTYKNSRAISRNGETRSWEPNRMLAAYSWSFRWRFFLAEYRIFCVINVCSKSTKNSWKVTETPSEMVLSIPKER